MKTLTWDVDDVLNHLMRDWLEIAWLPDHPECTVTYAQIRENPPERILGVSQETYLNSLDDFRQARGHALKPDPTVLAWFRNHGHRFRHMALTRVPLRFAPTSAAWIMKHFGNWIRSFNVVPSPRVDAPHIEYDASKAEFLDWLGGSDMMIDDSPKTIEEVGRHSVPTLLWPQPWNDSRLTPDAALDTLIRLDL